MDDWKSCSFSELRIGLSGGHTICEVLKFRSLAVSEDLEPSSGRRFPFLQAPWIGRGRESGSTCYVSSSNDIVEEEDKSYLGRREELRGAW
jgi:hypothetical protein